MRSLLAFVVLAATIVLAATAADVSVVAAPGVAALNLRLADLPPGYVQMVSRVYTDAQWAKVVPMSPVAQLVKEGRIATSVAQFGRGAHDSIFAVKSTVAQFTTVAGARARFLHDRALHDRFADGQAIKVGTIGSARFGYREVLRYSYFTYYLQAVYFYRGRYETFVLTVSPGRDGGPLDAVRFAALVDSRLRTAR